MSAQAQARAMPVDAQGRLAFLESPRFYWYLCFANALLIIAFWWHTASSLPTHTPADLVNSAGRLLGLLGTYLVLWQLLLMARLPQLERAFGMERLIVIHRLNAYASLGLILAHGVVQTIGYMMVSHLGFLSQLGAFATGYQGMLMAIAGLILMIVVAGLSVAAARRRLSYQAWYFIHLYAYLAVAIAFVHELLLGADFISSPAFSAYFIALYVIVGACLLGFRVAAPVLRWRRYGLKVERVVREAHGAVSVYVTGRGVERIRFEPGQFMIWRFLDRRRWWEAHPYSLSMPPNRQHLRLTARALGDFSSALADLVPGTPVIAEGPFGHFTSGVRSRDKVLLIAGGIGVTPIRSLAEEMAEEGVDVRVIYSVRRERDFAFKAEFERLEDELGVQVDYLVDDKRQRRQVEWFRSANLRRLVPDVAERDLYVCGPAGLTEELLRSAAQLSIPESRVHVEAFKF